MKALLHDGLQETNFEELKRVDDDRKKKMKIVKSRMTKMLRTWNSNTQSLSTLSSEKQYNQMTQN